ncbi:DNA-3-methyladenine glycosylase family protein [Roseivirga thermotolerans]|uniref:DNA-3-methyladenine glycosylase family protein n=1 Tax=Roseivirga thermotolerans TaxID=1758176 RepID=UPI001E60D26B|nr:DNA glycosylase [Roseivirga thermotolerans]
MKTQLNLACSPPFDFNKCLNALYRSTDEILYQVIDGSVFRLIKLENEYIPVALTGRGNEIIIETPQSLTPHQTEQLKQYVGRWFDADRDLKPFYALVESHPKLAHLSSQLHGLRIMGIPDLFEALCWSIIGQQINLSFAHKLKRRLVELYGEKLTWKEMDLYHFPSPEKMLTIDEEYLHNHQQFSRSKLKYLKNVAQAFVSGNISHQRLLTLPDFESKQALLTSVKGIGVWSANYALMKSFGAPKAIPFGDTGLTQALFNLGLIDDRKNEDAIRAFFKTMPGWEAYTVFYLWNSLSS